MANGKKDKTNSDNKGKKDIKNSGDQHLRSKPPKLKTNIVFDSKDDNEVKNLLGEDY